jgi:diguanylate cyclase
MMPHLSDVPASDVARTFAALRDANEQLILSALRSQLEMETRQRDIEMLSRAAELDPLTALPNRALLLDRFELARALALRHDSRLALLFLDLNNFKQINDTLGHLIGDEVLQDVAQTLTASVRAADTVSRHSGDEFVILLTDLAQPADAALIAEKLIAALGTPKRIGAHVVRLGSSIGISVFPDDGADARRLIDLADAAMYRAKRRGFAGFAFHSDAEASGTLVAPPRVHPPVIGVEAALSDRELRESALREANEQLVLVALSAKALHADSEEARRRQTDFMGQLAHELRNPLGPMLNVAALLTGVHSGDASLPKLQAIIERQVLYMARLVDDLLDVSRTSTGKLSLHSNVVDISAVIAESVANCRASMDLRLQTFTTQFPPLTVFVDGDRDRLRQVVCNLLDNASKYTPEHGVINLAVTTGEDAMHITVTDNGIGIAAESLSGIFEMFVQDQNALESSSAGLGIGLAVVHELVHAHGGSVEARSAGVGQGCTFVVTLPLVTLRRDAIDRRV